MRAVTKPLSDRTLILMCSALLLLAEAFSGKSVAGASVVATPFTSCSRASGSPGYVPSCIKIDTEKCEIRTIGAAGESSVDSSGDCGFGKLKVQRFTGNAERETVCLDVNNCGTNVALCQEWDDTRKVPIYKCVKNKSINFGSPM